MRLHDLFQGDPEGKEQLILDVLNAGLHLAENPTGQGYAAVGDLAHMLRFDKIARPHFQAGTSPRFQEIYDGWFAKNQARIAAIIEG